MRIIKATELIPVEHPVFLIFSQPGLFKTSLAYSAKNPLLIDADHGSHRAVNRRDTLAVETWADIAEMTESKDALAAYDTIIPDTVGRVLDLLIADIIEKNPKYARDGALTQQGWGVLKNRFRTWMALLRAMGKDVLLIAHHKEEKDGDVTVTRPDIVGGSYGEVMKIADFVGYGYMRGSDRILDFSPTDRWPGKNPAGWSPFKVPAIPKATSFMADLMDKGRAALGNLSAESVKVMAVVEEWRSKINDFTGTDECTKAVDQIAGAKLSAIVEPQVKKLLMDRARVLGFVYSPELKAFVEKPQPEPAGVQA